MIPEVHQQIGHTALVQLGQPVQHRQRRRATGATSATFTDIATTSNSRFTDSTVSPATTYRYRVRARIVPVGMIWGFTNIVAVATPT